MEPIGNSPVTLELNPTAKLTRDQAFHFNKNFKLVFCHLYWDVLQKKTIPNLFMEKIE